MNNTLHLLQKDWHATGYTRSLHHIHHEQGAPSRQYRFHHDPLFPLPPPSR